MKNKKYEVLFTNAVSDPSWEFWEMCAKAEPQPSGWLHYEFESGTKGQARPGNWREVSHNARLKAAAPELLEVCKLMVAHNAMKERHRNEERAFRNSENKVPDDKRAEWEVFLTDQICKELDLENQIEKQAAQAIAKAEGR